RGGILDFYSPGGNLRDDGGTVYPVRVEFFGDEIESIREFDPETQRSVREMKETLIAPMRDERASKADFRTWAKLAREHWSDERYERALRDRLVFADEGEEFQGWEYLMPLARPLTAAVFDYLREMVLVVDEPAELEKNVRSTFDELQRSYERAESIDELGLAPEKLFLTPDELRHEVGKMSRIELRLLGSSALTIEDELRTEDLATSAKIKQEGNPRLAAFVNRDPSAPLFLFPPEIGATEISISSRAVRRWHGHFAELAAETKELFSYGQQTIFVLPSTGVAERIGKVLGEYDALGTATLIVGDLSVGFSLPGSRLSIYTEADLFDEAVPTGQPTKTSKARRSQAAAFLSDFRDLKIGDYIFHIDHGIGQFQGLVQLDTSGPEPSAEIYARMTSADTNNGNER